MTIEALLGHSIDGGIEPPGGFRVNEVLRRIYRSRHVDGPDGSAIDPFPEAIPYAEGKALYDLIRQAGARRTLEIGMAYGLSTLFMCQALHDSGGGGGGHVAIDPFETTRWQAIGIENLRRANLASLMELHEVPSHEALPRLLHAGRRFDLVFIDGNHRFDYTLLEFQYLDRMLVANGHMVIDDIDLPAVRKLVTYVLRNKPYRMIDQYSQVVRSRARRVRRVAKAIIQTPFDILPAVTLAGHTRFCTLQKVTDDTSRWSFYRPF